MFLIGFLKKDAVHVKLTADIEKHFTPAAFVVPIPMSGAELRRKCQEAAMDNMREIIAGKIDVLSQTCGE